MTAYGAFVELEEGIDGMIHVSDLSWTRKINHPSEVLKKGDEVEAEVLDIDKANQRISLGIKQLGDDPWKEIDQKYKIGDLVQGKVTKLASFGAFVQLEDDIDGLVHISQISEDHVDKVKDVLKVGQEVEARVIKVDKAERRIGLSIKAANYSRRGIAPRIRSLRYASPRRRYGRPGESLRCRRAGRLSARRGEQPRRRRPRKSRRRSSSSIQRNFREGGRASDRLFCFPSAPAIEPNFGRAHAKRRTQVLAPSRAARLGRDELVPHRNALLQAESGGTRLSRPLHDITSSVPHICHSEARGRRAEEPLRRTESHTNLIVGSRNQNAN